jgi:hypothetical protein
MFGTLPTRVFQAQGCYPIKINPCPQLRTISYKVYNKFNNVYILSPLVWPFGYQHSGNLGRRVATLDFDLESLYVVPTVRTGTSSLSQDCPTFL